MIDFDKEISRAGTHAEKYEARATLFGKKDVAPFWVADMDLPTPPVVTTALQERIVHPMFGYTESYEAIFDAVRFWMSAGHQVSVDPEEIRFSPSVVTSICNGVTAFTDKGDQVALLSPVYGPFFTSVTNLGRQVVDIPLLLEDGQHQINFDALETALACATTKLLLLCNPHNPGGRVWNWADLEKIGQLCKQHQVVLFSDEIHSDVVYAPNTHTSVLAVPACRECAVMAHSIGKTFNASGLNASIVIIPNPRHRQAFAAAQEKSHSGAINLLGKVAMTAAFSQTGLDYRTQLVGYLQGNRDTVVERLGQVPKLGVMAPEATFLVYLDFRPFGPWPTVMKKLVHQANVALSGGPFFGPAGEGWFRLNIAHPKDNLLAAVTRIAQTFTTDDRR